MNERMKIILRIVMAGLILAVLNLFDGEISSLADWNLTGVLYFAAYLISGYDVILGALRGIREGEIFDEHFLMSVATIGALILGENFEACAVMMFYQVGELFSDYASDRTRENISALMDLRPDYANLETEDGTSKRVDPSAVEEGSVIIIKPGEKIPIDGAIIEGHSGIDTSALTGESVPRSVKAGDEVLSGTVNLSGVLRVKTTKTFTESTASKILELIESADNSKSHSEKFITRFARIYTPAVCVSALALALIPPIFAGNLRAWVYRALTFLVVSCPCALVVSVPLAFFAAVGGAGRRGILVKGGIFVERLAELSAVIFDKTGTLTRGVFEVSSVKAEAMTENELLHIAAHAERYSTHPAALALRRAYPNEADGCTVEDAEEIAGFGVRARVRGSEVCAGNLSFISGVIGDDVRPCSESGTVVHVSSGGNYAGHVVISDRVKDNAKSAVDSLRAEGVKRVIMLTGDNESSAKETANSLGIDEYYSGLLPADKVKRVESVDGVRAFVGDGINDAPVLSGADVGLAMGCLGSDAAIEAADVVIMDDDLMKIPEAVRISRKCMRIVRENVYGSIGVKILCLGLCAVGLAGMRLAVFADVGVLIIAVLNSVRAMFAANR
ncbi:MAG: cadmium-translocating P-type ATPase [Synergistaceae bacterium]|nr:cadmium-translocating P-type ATPase [Synergistaceae bacterium]